MMELDLTEIVNKLKTIELNFNSTENPTERYALIQALNHIGENEIPIHGNWEDIYRKAMLEAHGVARGIL
jgi:hypothetical protein